MTAPTSSAQATYIPNSTNVNINALLGGYKWGGAVGTSASVSYSFPWVNGASAVFAGYQGASYSNSNEASAPLHFGLNSTQQLAATQALAAWSNVANISFPQVSDTSTNVGDIRFAFSSATSLNNWWGYSSFPNSYWPSAGDVWINAKSAQDSSWSAGSYNFEGLVHEIGHSLGLKHPFEGSPTLDASLESRLYTLMSYNDPANNLFVRVMHNANGSVSWSSFNVNPETPMLLDIAALQYLYGANTGFNSGDTSYTFDPVQPMLKTIWDGGGVDTISLANFTRSSLLDLRPGHFSNIATALSDSTAGYNWISVPPTPTYDANNNLCIAYSCTIENATGGSGNDTLIGNDAANTLTGGDGNDTLTGGGGSDLISGGNGSDTATLDGPYSNFNVTAIRNASAGKVTGFAVRDYSESEGTDTVATDVEALSFNNGQTRLTLGSDGTVTVISNADKTPIKFNGQVIIYTSIGLTGTALTASAYSFASAQLDASGFRGYLAGLQTPSVTSLEDRAFATLIMNNLGVTSTSIGRAGYDALLPAVAAYLNNAGVANRTTVTFQLAKIVSNLAGDPTFGSAAASLNKSSLDAYLRPPTLGFPQQDANLTSSSDVYSSPYMQAEPEAQSFIVELVAVSQDALQIILPS